MTPDEWLLRIIRGEVVAVSDVPGDTESLLAAAEHHSVLPLAADALTRLPEWSGHPLAERIRGLAMHHAAIDLEREVELRAVIRALDEAGARPLVFKGAHLAYGCYPRPDLRPRVDTDVLIDRPAAARGAAHDALIALGYATRPHAGGDLVMTQRTYVKRQGSRVVHAVDVHWRLANPQAFAEVLTLDELLRDAQPIAALGAAARGPSLLHALVIACVHRVAHHADADCLIWLYDIDCIARAPSGLDWRTFAELITERQVEAVCRASLRRAAHAFGTPIPFDLASESLQPGREATARFLQGPQGSAASALDDVRHTRSWRARFHIAREHAFPPAAYMREVYAPDSRAPLAYLYLRRIVSAATRTF